jgi:hypothetical protein
MTVAKCKEEEHGRKVWTNDQGIQSIAEQAE